MTAGQRRLLGVCWLVCSVAGLSAQDCHVALRGKITEAETREPLAFATVVVAEANRVAVSDIDGVFVVPNLCEGATYTISVSHVECEHQTQVVRLTENTLLEFHLNHHVLQEISIVEKAVAPTPAQSAVELSGAELAASQGQSLGQALRNLPGLSSLNTGATISKPVIQGLHSNRVAIINNQVALESQQWGAEHAPEIDPFGAQKITVVKGAAGVRYGVGAMAGAIVLEAAPLRKVPGWGGWLSLGGFSNGGGGVGAAAVDWHAPGSSLALRLQGTLKRSGNLRAPDYWLGNTAAGEQNLALSAGWKTGSWSHEASWSRFAQQLGILRAAHIGNLSDLQRAIDSPTPLQNDDWFSYRIDRPRQTVQHYLARYKTTWYFAEKWKSSAQYAFQYNQRREYDVVRQSGSAADKAQLAFQLWSNQLDLSIEHLPIRHWEGGIGLQGIQQLNYVGKGGLIPDYQTFGGALWLLERWRRYPHPWEYEFGLRYDYRQTQATTSGSLNNIDTLVRFGNLSATGGIIWHLSKSLSATLHAGYAWRPPHANELFARGVHHGAATYEQGRPDLQAEKAWNNSLSLQFSCQNIQLQASVYHNRIDNFIYLDPQRTAVLTSRGAFPAYFYTQATARLQGADASASIPLFAGISLEGRASLLRGYRLARDSGDHARRRDWLPLLPADRYQYGLQWQPRTAAGTFFRLMASTTLRQSRIPEAGLLKSPPPAFTLFSFDAGHRLTFKNPKKQKEKEAGPNLEIGLSIQNLGNIRYREYLNFFRFFADEPGLNVGLRARWTF